MLSTLTQCTMMLNVPYNVYKGLRKSRMCTIYCAPSSKYNRLLVLLVMCINVTSPSTVSGPTAVYKPQKSRSYFTRDQQLKLIIEHAGLNFAGTVSQGLSFDMWA